MKSKLLVIVTTFVCLLCPAWEGAAAAGLGCTLVGHQNNTPSTWEVYIEEFKTYRGVTGSYMIGVNRSTNAGLNGSVYLYGGFPVYVQWTEYPTQTSNFVRFISVTLGPNLQGTGTMRDIGTSIFNGTVGITSTDCAVAELRPRWTCISAAYEPRHLRRFFLQVGRWLAGSTSYP